MKLFEIPMVVMSLLGLHFLADPQVPAARADFTFGPRVKVDLGRPASFQYGDGGAVLSRDGLELYFTSNRPGGYGDNDIWVSKRARMEDSWGPAVNLGPGINSAGLDTPTSISSDGLTLYLWAWQGNHGEMYTATRPTKDAPWGPRVNMGPVLNTGGTGGNNWFAVISPDDLELYFLRSNDIHVSTRATPHDPWGPPVNLGPTVNTGGAAPAAMSPDGLTLFILSNRAGGFGGYDTWMTWWPSPGAAWSTPVNLGSSFNTSSNDYLTCVSPDGRWACIDEMASIEDVWMAPIIPFLDLNGDDRINDQDILVLRQPWGQADPLCDIGPFPWGDGVVDTHDLRVLMEAITGSDPTTPLPHASEVSRAVILRWVSPAFAQAYDVYFGTSLADVNNADRANPRGVLVSKAQTTAAYQPAGLLEYGRTYYWRVDFVGAGAAPAIYRGAILDFTTEAFAYPIKRVTATASGAQAGSGPEKTVDGSGLDKSDRHSTEEKDMWWSLGVLPTWIQYEFDKVYTLHELWVWNFNSKLEPFLGFGAKTVKIEYSSDGKTWTPLAGVPEFARAPGQSGYVHNTTVAFGGVSARFVKLTIEKNWGVIPQTGLSEVRFFYIPDRSGAKP